MKEYTRQEQRRTKKRLNRELGRLLNERDKRDKRIALTWFGIGVTIGLLLSLI